MIRNTIKAMHWYREKRCGIIAAAALTVLLCGCAAFPANSSDAPKLRFPGHVVARADDTQLDLSKLGHEDVAAALELLLQLPELIGIELCRE